MAKLKDKVLGKGFETQQNSFICVVVVVVVVVVVSICICICICCCCCCCCCCADRLYGPSSPFSLACSTGYMVIYVSPRLAGWWFGCHFLFSHILGIIIPID